jgi:hypothetical protein
MSEKAFPVLDVITAKYGNPENTKRVRAPILLSHTQIMVSSKPRISAMRRRSSGICPVSQRNLNCAVWVSVWRLQLRDVTDDMRRLVMSQGGWKLEVPTTLDLQTLFGKCYESGTSFFIQPYHTLKVQD